MPKKRKAPDRKISDLFPLKKRRPDGRQQQQDADKDDANHQQAASNSSSVGCTVVKATEAAAIAPAAAPAAAPVVRGGAISTSSSATLVGVGSGSSGGGGGGGLSQQDLAVLRDFDLNWEFGPCIGISRLQRWERAVKRGLSPSLAVRSLVLAHSGNPLYTQCIWFAYSDLM